MGKQRVRWLLFAVAICYFAPLTDPKLQAERVYSYDLDSLVHLSTDVIEGEILRQYEAHGHKLTDVKVALPHKGSFEKGQTVVVIGTRYFQKPKQGGFGSQPLAAGDRLVLFLVRVKTNEMNLIPNDAVIYDPLPGGMRLIQDDHVFGFSENSRGPGVAQVPADPVKAKSLTLEHFREKVKNSLRDTQEWARLAEAPTLDAPRLLKLLAHCSEPTDGTRSYFAQQICIRFANSHDPELLSQALPLAAKDHRTRSIVERGFGTPRGRDYLLAKVSDNTEPMAARLRYAVALAEAGEVYHQTFTEICASSWTIVGEAREGNSAYLTRIANVALANEKHEELCRRLVRCVDYFGRDVLQDKPRPMDADRLGAYVVLKRLYEKKPSQDLQFAIEVATAHDRNSYEKLNSPCGNVISILRAADPARYTKPAKRSLIFEYEYTAVLLNRELEVQPEVVLVHQGTQQRHVFPSQLKIRGGHAVGGSNSVELPKDLPVGRYHMFLQLSDGDKVISTGHYFAADL